MILNKSKCVKLKEGTIKKNRSWKKRTKNNHIAARERNHQPDKYMSATKFSPLSRSFISSICDLWSMLIKSSTEATQQTLISWYFVAQEWNAALWRVFQIVHTSTSSSSYKNWTHGFRKKIYNISKIWFFFSLNWWVCDWISISRCAVVTNSDL